MTMMGMILLAAALLAASLAARRLGKRLRPLGLVVVMVLLPLMLIYGLPVATRVQQAMAAAAP